MSIAVKEPIEVIAYFNKLELKVLKFRWKNRVYKPTAITGKWKIKDGDGPETHFSVECKNENINCELAYHHNNWKWELIQINYSY